MYSGNPKPWPTLALLLCLCLHANASRTRDELAVSAIPSALQRGADAVMRQYDEEIEVVSPLEVKIRYHYVLTLLHAAAADARHLAAYSSGLQKLEDVNARIYNAAGEEVKYIRKKDFKSRPINIGGSGYSDVELREYTVDYAVYPFTIEFSSVVTSLHSFLLPEWSPQQSVHDIRTAVEQASLKVSAPVSAGFRYWSYGTDAPVMQQKDGIAEWQWTLAARPYIRREPFPVNTVYHSPTVLMSLNEIAVKGFTGSAATWDSLGRFINQMNKGRDILSEDDKARVHALTDQLTTNRAKIEALYRHMQQRMRYVAVEIGVGGWQTLDASFVGQNQYGDCKGLSNYMMAMLKEAGITAYPVIISAGEDYKPLAREFPSSHFNHEILCVPSPQDTVWLECTSNDAPAGYLGAFTADRDALMLTEAGGVVVRTPALNHQQNVLQRTVYAKIDSSLAYDMTLDNRHSAYWCDKLRPFVQHLADAQLQQYVSNKFTLPAYTVNSYQYAPEDHASLPVWKESIRMRATAMATASGKRLFITPDLLPLDLPDLSGETQRRTDFCIQHSYTIADSFVIDVPTGRVVENLPASVNLNTGFGSYYLNTSFEEGRINVQRKLIMQAGNYPAAEYSAFMGFLEKVKRSGRDKLVLRTP